ncbi:MAG: hypothetical protein JSV97_00915 [candidate division WOR-3 bacterium]|nr:MAG: hypothetical protein JSV97_00915 [candidate division WOR-3 bacterium]
MKNFKPEARNPSMMGAGSSLAGNEAYIVAWQHYTTKNERLQMDDDTGFVTIQRFTIC